jgi:hypothetical protein
MSRPRWYAGRAPITATVQAGEQTHRVTWRHGRLTLHDHDLAAEEVLQALGGEPCGCLALRDVFRGLGAPPGRTPGGGLWFAYPRVTPRPAASPARRQVMGPLQVFTQLSADPNFRRLTPEQRGGLLARVRRSYAGQVVPPEMSQIVQLVDEQRATRQQRRAEAPQPKPTPDQRLQAAVQPAMREAMRWAQGHLRPDATLTVSCWKDRPGEPAVLQGSLTSRGGFVTVSLPVRWLNRVWMRGLSCLDGSFVLEVDAAAPATDLSGTAVRWERHVGGHLVPVVASCRIRRVDGRWRLSWIAE